MLHTCEEHLSKGIVLGSNVDVSVSSSFYLLIYSICSSYVYILAIYFFLVGAMHERPKHVILRESIISLWSLQVNEK